MAKSEKSDKDKQKKVKKPFKQRLVELWNRWLPRLVMLLLIFVVIVILFWERIFVPVYPGHSGVVWKRFDKGTQMRVFGEGYYLIYPWDKFYVYEVRLQEIHDDIELLTSTGMKLDVSISTRFHPKKNELALLHQEIGPDYVERMVRPRVISSARNVIGNYNHEDIYARDEGGLLDALFEETVRRLNDSHVFVEDVVIKKLLLPEDIQDEINDKHAQEQRSLGYTYRLISEQKEADRRRLEAQGIKDFTDISGVSILTWRGLEATEKLSESENAKIILMGTGKDGLPVILNADSK